jgi:hypothetical protein
MRWKMDEVTRSDLEYAFSRRWNPRIEGVGPTIPEPLYAALSLRSRRLDD